MHYESGVIILLVKSHLRYLWRLEQDHQKFVCFYDERHLSSSELIDFKFKKVIPFRSWSGNYFSLGEEVRSLEKILVKNALNPKNVLFFNDKDFLFQIATDRWLDARKILLQEGKGIYEKSPWVKIAFRYCQSKIVTKFLGRKITFYSKIGYSRRFSIIYCERPENLNKRFKGTMAFEFPYGRDSPQKSIGNTNYILLCLEPLKILAKTRVKWRVFVIRYLCNNRRPIVAKYHPRQSLGRLKGLIIKDFVVWDTKESLENFKLNFSRVYISKNSTLVLSNDFSEKFYYY